MSLVPVEMVTVKIEPHWEAGAAMHHETTQGPKTEHQNIAHVKQETEENHVNACQSTVPASFTNQAEHNSDGTNGDNGHTETKACDTSRLEHVGDVQGQIQQSQDRLDVEKETVTAGKSSRKQASSKSKEQTRSEQEPYSCSICHKKFRHISNLNIHERIHTGEKPFSCEVCHQRFAQLSNLKVHKRIHTGEKPYACTTCDQRFTMLSNLKKHERIHTGDKPYSCDSCPMKFTLLGNLKTHQRIHTGEKIYSCGTCERKFTQLSSLKSHERTHTGEKPFWCDLCKKGYTRKSHLDQHVKKKKNTIQVALKPFVKSKPV